MPYWLFGSYFVDVYMLNSIVSFEFDNKLEALAIVDMYVEKAQTICFYSYQSNPYNNEFNKLYPHKLAAAKKTANILALNYRHICDMFRRKENAIAFNSYRSSVRNNRYFSRK